MFVVPLLARHMACRNWCTRLCSVSRPSTRLSVCVPPDFCWYVAGVVASMYLRVLERTELIECVCVPSLGCVA